MGILHTIPFLLWFTDFLFILEGNIALLVMNAVPDVVLILQNTFDLCNRPHIGFRFIRSFKHMGKGAVPFEVIPSRSRNLFLYQ